MRRISEGILGALAVVVSVLLSPILRPWYRGWGASKAERERALPGDYLLPQPRLCSTRAITIAASAREVWPWLIQIGQGRGGFYSYEVLENLIGLDIHNADSVIPRLQNIEVGDLIRLGPDGYPYYEVVAIEPHRALVLHAGDGNTQSTWAFQIEDQGDGACRLIVRDRTSYEPKVGNFVIWRLLTDPIHFVMERKMLLGIKARVERSSGKSAMPPRRQRTDGSGDLIAAQ